MKIPQILAQEPVAVPRVPQAQFVPERGLALVGRSLAQVGDVLGEAANAKRILAAKTEAALRKSEFDVGLATMDSNLRLTHSDPDAYLAAYTQGVQQLHAATLESTQSEDAKGLLGLELTRAAGLHLVEAQKHYNSLYVGRAQGQLDTTQDNLKILLGTATTDAQRSDIYGRGLQNIDTMLPILGAKQAADRKIGWRNDVLMNDETRKIEDNPTTWNPNRLQGILPDDKLRILEERHARATAAAIRLADKHEKDFAAALKADQQQLVVEMDRKAAEGTLTLKELNLRIDMRQIPDDADARRLRQNILEGPVQRPSDPDILTRVSMDSNSSQPRTTEADIDNLRSAHQAGRPGLNLKDAVTLKDKIVTTNKALRKEGDSDLSREHNQAEQMWRAALGIRPGLISEVLKDDPAGRIYAAGLEELTRRSLLFKDVYGGQERPLTVIEDMIPRGQKALGTSANLKTSELQGLLAYPTMQALEADWQNKKISQSAYEYQRSLMLRMEAIRKRAIEQQQEQLKKPGTPAPRL